MSKPGAVKQDLVLLPWVSLAHRRKGGLRNLVPLPPPALPRSGVYWRLRVGGQPRGVVCRRVRGSTAYLYLRKDRGRSRPGIGLWDRWGCSRFSTAGSWSPSANDSRPGQGERVLTVQLVRMSDAIASHPRTSGSCKRAYPSSSTHVLPRPQTTSRKLAGRPSKLPEQGCTMLPTTKTEAPICRSGSPLPPPPFRSAQSWGGAP